MNIWWSFRSKTLGKAFSTFFVFEISAISYFPYFKVPRRIVSLQKAKIELNENSFPSKIQELTVRAWLQPSWNHRDLPPAALLKQIIVVDELTLQEEALKINESDARM